MKTEKKPIELVFLVLFFNYFINQPFQFDFWLENVKPNQIEQIIYNKISIKPLYFQCTDKNAPISTPDPSITTPYTAHITHDKETLGAFHGLALHTHLIELLTAIGAQH